MAELRAGYNREFLSDFGEKVKRAYPAFEKERFVEEILAGDWESLELKRRTRKISTILGKHLPSAYDEALEILFQIDEECEGFYYLFFPDFVEVHGLSEAHWEASMIALERFTMRSTSEFAIRVFILEDSSRMIKQMLQWSEHPNEHVRRLASEGCRPRLPWGQSLPMFKKDPTEILPILENLLEDPSAYVRKSVANNLNDIAKDNPETVVSFVRKWKNKNPLTDWILRHGSRTLLRKANPEIMELFSYPTLEIPDASIAMEASDVTIGEKSKLSYEIGIPEGKTVKIRVEYGIDFVKSRGNLSRKLFRLSDREVEGGAFVKGERSHNWADLSTRKHYPGVHRIGLFVNGLEVASTEVNLYSE